MGGTCSKFNVIHPVIVKTKLSPAVTQEESQGKDSAIQRGKSHDDFGVLGKVGVKLHAVI